MYRILGAYYFPRQHQNQTAVSDTLHFLSDFQLDPRSYKNTRFPNMIWTFGYVYLSQNGNTAIPRYCNGSQYVRASFKIIMVMRYSNNTLAILWCGFTSKTCRPKTCCHHVQAYTAIVEQVRTEQNFPPLYFRQYLLFLEKNRMGERRMPRRVQKHPQNCTGVST